MDATSLDTALLSGVVGLAHGKLPGQLAPSFKTFDHALASGKLPAGQVSDRLVRSAFAALARVASDLTIDHVPNPFPAPHNLSWYFGQCVCPIEVRQFATLLGRRYLRVWSVAQARDGWKILIQVFGNTGGAAKDAVELEATQPSKRLNHYFIQEVKAFTLSPTNVNDFLHEYARTLLSRQETGSYVELHLARGS